jgi:hypothetical protein
VDPGINTVVWKVRGLGRFVRIIQISSKR